MPKLTFLQMLLQLLQGKHTEHKDVIFTRVTEISIKTDPGTPVHADGEVFSTSETISLFSFAWQSDSVISKISRVARYG